MPDPTLDDDYFTEIINAFRSPGQKSKLAFVVVTHAAPDIPAFFVALEKLGRVAQIIFKSSCYQEDLITIVKQTYPGIVNQDVTKKSLKESPDSGSEIIGACTNEDEECIILDIGGYFAPCLETLNNDYGASGRVIAIIEDTQNGHNRYVRYRAEIQGQCHIKIASVAQSEQKKTEDYNVGKSIAHSVEALLRENLVMLEDCEIGVLGHGKIGASVATNLRNKNVKELHVYDHDPLIRQQAAASDFKITDNLYEFMQKSRVIVSATGKQALNSTHFQWSGFEKVWAASVTSSDDEFGFDVGELTKVNPGNDKVPYSTLTLDVKGAQKQVIFLAEGNAINFSRKTNALGDYIRGVQATILAMITRIQGDIHLLEQSSDPRDIYVLSRRDETIISKIWMRKFKNSSIHVNGNLPVIVSTQRVFDFQRGRMLMRIKDHLKAATYSVCIQGAAGIGKSFLVREYIDTHSDLYDFIWVINGNLDLLTQYRTLAEALKLRIKEESTSQKNIFGIIIQELSKIDSLIFFDDLEDRQQIFDIANTAASVVHGRSDGQYKNKLNHILLTTRADFSVTKHQKRSITGYKLQAFTKEDSREYFSSYTPDCEFYDTLWEIVPKLRGLPYSHALVKSYIDSCEHPDDASTYLQRINHEDKESTLKAILQAVIQKVMQIQFADRHITFNSLMICCFLDGKNIQLDLISKIAKAFYLPAAMVETFIIEPLVKYGLLEKRRNSYYETYLHMHKYTQEILMKYFLSDVAMWLKFFYMAHAIIRGLFNYDDYKQEHEKDKNYKNYILHAKSLLRYADQHKKEHDITQYLLESFEVDDAEMCQTKLAKWVHANRHIYLTRFLLIYNQAEQSWFFSGFDAMSRLIQGDLEKIPLLSKLSLSVRGITSSREVNTQRQKLLSLIVPLLGHSEDIYALSNDLLCRMGSMYLYELRDYETSLNYFSLAKEALVRIKEKSQLIPLESLNYVTTTHGYIITKLMICKRELDNIDTFNNIKKLVEQIEDADLKAHINNISTALDFSVSHLPKRDLLSLTLNQSDMRRLKLFEIDMLITKSYAKKYMGTIKLQTAREELEARELFEEARDILTQAEASLQQLSQAELLGQNDLIKRFSSILCHSYGSINLSLSTSYGQYSKEKRDCVRKSVEQLGKAVEMKFDLHGCVPHPDLAKSKYKYSVALFQKSECDAGSADERIQLLETAIKECDEAIEFQHRTISKEHPDFLESCRHRAELNHKYTSITGRTPRSDLTALVRKHLKRGSSSDSTSGGDPDEEQPPVKRRNLLQPIHEGTPALLVTEHREREQTQKDRRGLKRRISHENSSESDSDDDRDDRIRHPGRASAANSREGTPPIP